MLLINEATSYELLGNINEAIPWLAQSFRAITAGPTVGLRSDVDDPERESRGLLLGSYVGAMDGVCFKVIGNWRGNRAGLIVVFNTATGCPEVLLSAAHVTDVRTGAASGAATEQLARRDSRRLAVLGTGRQSATQLQAMLAIRPIEIVNVWNRTQANAVTWIGKMKSNLNASVPVFRLCDSPEEACKEADIIVVSTRAEEPVLHGAWLRPGTHINAVGASTPDQRELDLSVLQRADVKTVDSRELALNTGDFLGPIQQGILRSDEIQELGELLLGIHPGRTDDNQITLFKSVGHAANDLVVARWMAEQAREAGLGITVEL